MHSNTDDVKQQQYTHVQFFSLNSSVSAAWDGKCVAQ